MSPYEMFQAAVILLLFGLLIEKEILRVTGGEKAEQWMKKLNRMIVPMFLLFLLIIGSRLSSFIY